MAQNLQQRSALTIPPRKQSFHQGPTVLPAPFRNQNCFVPTALYDVGAGAMHYSLASLDVSVLYCECG